MSEKTKCPKSLSASGRALWGRLTHDYEFRPDELAVVELACATVDAIRDLEATAATDGTMIAGSQGQTVLHPAIPEARMQRLVLARLLASLQLPDSVLEPAARSSARKAAAARWGRGA